MAQHEFISLYGAPQFEKRGAVEESYLSVHNADSASYTISGAAPGQWFDLGRFGIKRILLCFDTSSLSGIAIESAKLRFYCRWKTIGAGKDYDVVVVRGDFTDPSLDVYGRLLDETESRGSINTALITAHTYYEIELNAIGLSEINKDGYTRFALRSSRDIAVIQPDGYNETMDAEAGSPDPPNPEYPHLIVNAATSGYIWVEATKLHYIDQNGGERAFEGTDTGNNGTAGYLWVEGTYLHYIDENGDERRQEGTKEGATGKALGQFWIEGTKLRYIDADGDERYIEGDVV